MGKMLQVAGLTKKFKNTVAVNDISFSVNKGEIMGFLGPNGAGKTTAIRMIMGIIAADQGTVEFYYNDQPAGLDKSKVGYLPEEKGLYDDVKVIDNIMYLAVLKGVPRKEAKKRGLEWLQRLGLSEYSDEKLEKLSRGMKQKVQFIVSIIHQPDFVVLDEPFAGLDPINQEFVINIIRELQQEGLTILFSAHQMNMVEELCDSILMINQGQEVLQGDLREIKKSYDQYNVRLNFKQGSNLKLLKNITGLKIKQEQEEFVEGIYSGDREINDFVREITGVMKLESISVETPPLHDIFINLVQKRGESDEDKK